MTEVPPTPEVAPYVKILGQDGAMNLFLHLGGSEVLFSPSPQKRGRLAKQVGHRLAGELADAMPGKRRVPLAKPWVARVMAANDPSLPAAEIARRLLVTDKLVRRWLGERPRDDRQISLF